MGCVPSSIGDVITIVSPEILSPEFRISNSPAESLPHRHDAFARCACGIGTAGAARLNAGTAVIPSRASIDRLATNTTIDTTTATATPY
jgi:hypothetical protein